MTFVLHSHPLDQTQVLRHTWCVCSASSAHLSILILNLIDSSLCQLLGCLSVKNSVSPLCLFGENREFQLLLFVFHLVLGLEQDLGNLGESLLDSQLSEVALLNFISAKLLAAATGATVVLIAGARGFNHRQSGALHVVMGSKDNRRAIRSVRSIDGAHLALESDSVGQNSAWDLDSEHLLVLGSLFATTVHKSTAIRGQSVDNTADLLGHRENALVSSAHHHLVHDNLFSAKDNTVLADNSHDSATQKR